MILYSYFHKMFVIPFFLGKVKMITLLLSVSNGEIFFLPNVKKHIFLDSTGKGNIEISNIQVKECKF